jgi:hypothetical protein
MRYLLIALLLASCAKPAVRPWIYIMPGQDNQICATHRDIHTDEAHVHATFFFWARGATQPGDELLVTFNGRPTTVYLTNSFASTVTAPLGGGSHHITARWMRADGTIVAESWTSALVGACY